MIRELIKMIPGQKRVYLTVSSDGDPLESLEVEKEPAP
jgi:hypothetical protein